MRRYLVLALLAAAAVIASGEQASAQYPANYGFFPWGFYQPYGARYGTSLRTPPHFAVNPPVYYGARHARPYGLSPFASPPVMSPGDGYRGRLRSQFLQPPVATPGPQLSNPCVSHSAAKKPSAEKPSAELASAELVSATPKPIGPIRSNPFVDLSKIAQN